MVETIRSNMDRRLFSCGVFIDLKKAFHTVNHKILLDKLNYYGFRGIVNQWFSSYLTNRTQTTEINSYISDKEVVNCGVPQRSVLRPLLFLLYVNDIQHCSRKVKFVLFADDTNVLYSLKNLKTLELIVNAELNNLFNWLTSNKLTLNIKKTNFVIFRPQQKKLNYLPQINIFDNEQTNKNVILEHKNCIKFLGLLIDENLGWGTSAIKVSGSSSCCRTVCWRISSLIAKFGMMKTTDLLFTSSVGFPSLSDII